MHRAAEVVEAYRTVNQHLDGSKVKVIGSADARTIKRQLPECLKHATICNGTTEILGGFVTPQGTNREDEAKETGKWLTKMRQRYGKIAALPTTHQNKWLILHNSTHHHLYRAETFMVNDRCSVFDALDDLQVKTLLDIAALKGQPENLFVLTFTPIKDGGLGLFP